MIRIGRTGAKQILQTWFHDHVPQVMKNNPTYSFDLDPTHWDLDENSRCITVPFFPGQTPDDTFEEYRHGTRGQIALLIARDGLKSSGRSHNVIGAWLTKSREFALAWGMNSMDVFPGCYVTVPARPDELRANRNIGHGKAVAPASAAGDLQRAMNVDYAAC